jgi:hypothetical protein
MPVEVRFSIKSELTGEYEVAVEASDGIVRVSVPGENDLTFAHSVYKSSDVPARAARSVDAATLARSLAKVFRGRGVRTSITTL